MTIITARVNATRYSGALTIYLRLHFDDTYEARLRGPVSKDGRFTCDLTGLRVTPAMAEKHALDAAECFDAIARAAISFAAYETGGDEIYSLAELDEDLSANIRREA